MSGNDLKSNEGGKELAAAVDVIYTRDTKESGNIWPFYFSSHKICLLLLSSSSSSSLLLLLLLIILEEGWVLQVTKH